jgi:hypothetical protein
MLSLKQAGSIINGVYLALNKEDQTLLNETVNEIGLLNPFFRAYISYGRLEKKMVNMCLKLSAELLNRYYGKAPLDDNSEESEIFWSELLNEADNICKVICNYDEQDKCLRSYATNILCSCLEVIEQEHKRRNNLSKGEGK